MVERLYLGTTAEGINRELTTTLECSNICQLNMVRPLGRARQAIIRLASLLPGKNEKRERTRLLVSQGNLLRYPSWKDIARGILPSLQYIINEEIQPLNDGKAQTTLPDTFPGQGGEKGGFNPYKSSYNCILCNSELAELYYSCDGCESLLDKEYKFCGICYHNKKQLEYNKVVGLDEELDENEIIWSPMRHHVPLENGEMRNCDSVRCKTGDITCRKCAHN